MYVIQVLVAVGIVCVTVLVAGGRGDGLGPNMPEPNALLDPSRSLTPGDLEDVRFGVVPRGYRMTEVDEVLDRAETAIAERDERISYLEGVLGLHDNE